ncbi:hypothetical protein TNCV_4233091 [Trichonephila clavipes]|nr:hypothetical protein TNCV_4233091 [Trichonephila clavipes]
MRFGGEKATINRLPLVVAYGLLTACEEPPCSACTSYLSGADKSNRFTGSVELSGKFTTRLTTVLLNGRLQGFFIQGLCHPVRVLSQRDKSPDLNF